MHSLRRITRHLALVAVALFFVAATATAGPVKYYDLGRRDQGDTTGSLADESIRRRW